MSKMLVKTCTMCERNYYVRKVEDFANYFHRAKLSLYGFSARCKSCRHKVEVIPNREKRKDYDRQRRGVKIQSETNCIVCQSVFTPRNEDQKCCSKECTRFKKRVQTKLYFKEENYYEKIKKKRQKDVATAKKYKFKYTKEDEAYILANLDKGNKYIAKKLGRTVNGICKKIQKMKKVKNAN